MRQVICGSTLLLVLCGGAFGNTGVFSGSGHTLQLVKSADVQMVAEDVLIAPTVGKSAVENSAEFRCQFVLKNRSDKSVTIQVGFPLDRELSGPPPRPATDEEKVNSYHFTARDAKETYRVRYVGSDPKDKLAHIFLWDMSFAAGEKKELHVGYTLPMSVGMASTRKTEAPQIAFNAATDEPIWHRRIESSIAVYSIYVTETGRSWAGPIEKARFRYVNTAFERDLRNLAPHFGDDEANAQPAKDAQDDNPADDCGWMTGDDDIPGVKPSSVFASIKPDGWKPTGASAASAGQAARNHEPDGIEWKFDNYQAGEPLIFAYYLVGFPAKAEDCDFWVRRVLGKEPAKADLLELREIAATFYGVAPRTASVRYFTERQLWFNPRSDVGESHLSAAQRAVLARLSRLADASKETEAKPSSAITKSLLQETGLRANLHGHTAQVMKVVYSPDGKSLASGSCDQTVRLWDPATGKSTASLTGHVRPVTAVAFSRDSQVLASADWSGTILLWDLARRKSLGTLKGHTDEIRAVEFSPDGKYLASACQDTTVKLWDVAAGKCVATLAHDTNINSLAFSPDGRTIASGGNDNLVYLWDVASRTRTATMKGHTQCIFSLVFSPDGKVIASVSGDSTIRLWDPVEAKCLATLQNTANLAVAFSNDGKTLAAGGQGPKIELWDVAQRKRLATLGAQVAFVDSVSFSPDGKTLASSGDLGGLHNCTVKLWDVSRADPAK